MKYLFIILVALLVSCRATKKITAVKTVADQTATVSNSTLNQVSIDSSKEETESTIEALITEYELSNNAFPENADTTNEVVKILRSLPPGSKYRQTKQKEIRAVITNYINRDSISFVQKDSTGTKHDEKNEQTTITKKGNSFGIILIIVAFIGLVVSAYYLSEKFRNKV